MNHSENEQPVSSIDFGILLIRCLLLRHEDERLHHHVDAHWLVLLNFVQKFISTNILAKSRHLINIRQMSTITVILFALELIVILKRT